MRARDERRLPLQAPGSLRGPGGERPQAVQSAKALFASPLFTIGWGIGTGAWVFHVAAMSVAPLSLVQAVLAGGMVLLAVMAEQMFGCWIGRRQWTGLALTAFGLMLLGLHAPGRPRRRLAFLDPGDDLVRDRPDRRRRC